MTTSTTTPSSTPQADVSIEPFGPYEVYERIGVGGMATVHRAKERGIEGFERIVALKRLLPHLAEDASFVRAFVREAKLASMLQHANIVQLYELGRVGPVYFISMEYIEGRDVRKILRQSRRVTGPPPLPVFLSLMHQLCEALDYAHRRADQHGQPMGLVHRDVSPSNLIITESGHLKVIDFGIAKAQSQYLRTQTGRVKGKLAYMAPEAIKGQELDARSDLFSMGVIAHELLTARPLFASKNDYDTIMRVQRADIPRPSTINADCPPELDDMVLKAVARDPNKRWQSAAELRDALHFLRAHYQVSATNREVSTWLEWAFNHDAADTRSFAATTSSVLTNTITGVTTGSRLSAPPHQAFASGRARSHSGVQDSIQGAIPDASLSQRELAPGAVGGPTEQQAEPLPPPPVHMHNRAGTGRAAEDDVAELAWGGVEDDSGAPLLLDDVPDVSDKLAAVSLPGLRTGDTGVQGFGSGIVKEKHTRGQRLLLAVAALGLLAAALAVAVVIRRGADTAPQAPQVPPTATIKFAVEPADATIEVLSYGTHQGSPYTLEVEAPGIYRVQVQRAGYRSYVTELEVKGGENHVVRVALDTSSTDKAQVTVRSTPPGQRVLVNGAPASSVTPANLELAPGEHTIAIIDSSGQPLWHHEFTAARNTQYEFHPELLDEDKLRHREERRSDRRAPEQEREDRRRDRRAEATPMEIPIMASPSGSAPEASDTPAMPPTVSGTSAGSSSALATLDAVAPPPPMPVKPRGPVTIPPNLARKRSGRTERVTTMRSHGLPEKVGVKLCINTSGEVTSIDILTSLPRAVERALRSDLEDWRYQPHVQDGTPVPACFAVNFKFEN